LGRGFLAALIV